MESLSAMESHQKDNCIIHKCMDCPVCFKLCLSFINIIKICTNHSTNVQMFQTLG